jgi:cytoplasmic iron level regulating protein YaaA (DUF328/UPF0246 family)
VTDALNKKLGKDGLFVNLAVMNIFGGRCQRIKSSSNHSDFKDYKDGKLKIISFYAKKARGMMVRYIIDTEAKTIEDLKASIMMGINLMRLFQGDHLVLPDSPFDNI